MKVGGSSFRHGFARFGFYQRLKASVIYDLYWRIVDGERLESRAREITFYREVLAGLPPSALIFDIGANRGDKTDVFLRLGACVVAVDPDPLNAAILGYKFLRYRLTPKPLTIVAKAVSDRSGMATIWIDKPGSALNTLNGDWARTLRSEQSRFGRAIQFGTNKEVPTTTLDELIATYGRPFFIKVDVEGHEAQVLAGLHTVVPYVSFEVNLPDFRSEGQRCIELLARISAGAEFAFVSNGRSDSKISTWASAEDFLGTFDAISDPSVDVFCRMSDR